MSHRQYLLHGLVELGLLECHPQLVPMIEHICLTTNMATTLIDPIYYCKVVGKLRHISTQNQMLNMWLLLIVVTPSPHNNHVLMLPKQSSTTSRELLITQCVVEKRDCSHQEASLT
jgi:hypothetical protein